MDLHREFIRCLNVIRSDRQSEEHDGFTGLAEAGLADSFSDEFIAAMRAEQDPIIRGRLVEVLGYIDREDILEVVKQEMQHPEQNVRMWAEIVLVQHLGYQQQMPEALAIMRTLGFDV